MRKKIYLFLFFSISVKLLFAQVPTIEWIKNFGGSGGDAFRHIVAVDSDKIYVDATTNSIDGDVTGIHSGYDAWLLCIDTVGNILYQKCFGGSNLDQFMYSGILANGNFLFTGSTKSNDGDVIGNHNPGMHDAWIVESDNYGNIIDQRCMGGSGEDFFLSWKECTNGDMIFAGETTSTDGDLSGVQTIGNGDFWIVKTDSNYNIQWQKCYGGSGEEYVTDMLLTQDGGSLLLGISNSSDGDILNSFGMDDFWLLKIDSVGNKEWEKSFGGSRKEQYPRLIKSIDGSYMIFGTTASIDGMVVGNHDTLTLLGAADSWLLKIDSSGNLEWQKCYGGSWYEYGSKIISTEDSGYVLVGSASSTGGDVVGTHANVACYPYCDDMWVVKIDSIGSIDWQKCIGGYGTDYGRECIQLNNQGFLVLGETGSIDGDLTGTNFHGFVDACAVRLSSSNVHIPQAESTSEFSCWLNSNDDLFISINSSHISDNKMSGTINLFDVTGRLIFKQRVELDQGINRIKIPEIKSGVYFVNLEIAGERITQKLLAMKE